VAFGNTKQLHAYFSSMVQAHNALKKRGEKQDWSLGGDVPCKHKTRFYEDLNNLPSGCT
jgi:hypothetical protein